MKILDNSPNAGVNITEQSPTPGNAGFLARGPLVLDLSTRILTGPAGWADTTPGDFALLRCLMPARVVGTVELAAAAFPGEMKLRRPRHALAMRIARLRGTLERVGVSGAAIRCFHRRGYGMGLGSVRTRTFAGHRVLVLDALLASHPDREAVAALGQ